MNPPWFTPAPHGLRTTTAWAPLDRQDHQRLLRAKPIPNGRFTMKMQALYCVISRWLSELRWSDPIPRKSDKELADTIEFCRADVINARGKIRSTMYRIIINEPGTADINSLVEVIKKFLHSKSAALDRAEALHAGEPQKFIVGRYRSATTLAEQLIYLGAEVGIEKLSVDEPAHNSRTWASQFEVAARAVLQNLRLGLTNNPSHIMGRFGEGSVCEYHSDSTGLYLRIYFQSLDGTFAHVHFGRKWLVGDKQLLLGLSSGYADAASMFGFSIPSSYSISSIEELHDVIEKIIKDLCETLPAILASISLDTLTALEAKNATLVEWLKIHDDATPTHFTQIA